MASAPISSTKTSTETSATTAADAGWVAPADDALPPPKKNKRSKTQNSVYGFLVLKLTTKGGDSQRPPLIDELLEELPERAAWLDLPLDRVKELHAKATRIHKETHAPFKNTFIRLLTDATGSNKTPKTQAELDDEAEEAYQAQQRADAELRRRRGEQNHSSSGGGGGGASGGR